MSFEEECGYLRWGLSEKKNVLDLFRRYQDACDELIEQRRTIQTLRTGLVLGAGGEKRGWYYTANDEAHRVLENEKKRTNQMPDLQAGHAGTPARIIEGGLPAMRPGTIVEKE